ncbi:hypothetical protein H6F88_27935 [Oculatella sp. FACHB-28]|uniref:Npun_F0813 family protein n=1 Tax=Cyanophyceae TaxID=3028117 RepID=UPI001688C452|nr:MULTISPECIES: Npun_F0813 family protein [Cyanophyceae]MBD1866072.1 hypothetical protein [Cyanobacteria bacterium FACHB-471]MBD2059771.1 hypothetical protein [Oculatella sp. FACHB-28]MBD2071793.1 hypothetical protein [Leptolyngbya sp. FACHB-671]
MRQELQVTVSSPVRKPDIQIASAWDPTRNKRIPILHHQDQTFRLLNVFPKSQSKEVSFIWWNLTDNLGKTCLLLKGSKSHSIWEKVHLDELIDDASLPWNTADAANSTFVKATLLLLQAVYAEVDYFFGTRHAELFEKDVTKVIQQENFPQSDSRDLVRQLLKVDPLIAAHLVVWQERHLTILLQKVYELALEFFSNDTFTARVFSALEDLPTKERVMFTVWLAEQFPDGKTWKLPQTDVSKI